MLLGLQTTVIQLQSAITRTLGAEEMGWAETLLRAPYNPDL